MQESNSMKPRSRFLLLDIDGVCHPLKPSGHCLNASMADLAARADEELELSENSTGRVVAGEFEERNMAALARIVASTSATIVLSSTWRETGPQRRAVDGQLTKHGLPPHVGVTPSLQGDGRAAEILAWAAAHGSGAAWVAVDDLPLPSLPSNRFVQTDPAVGLTCADAERVIACFRAQLESDAPLTPPPSPPSSQPAAPRLRIEAADIAVVPPGEDAEDHADAETAHPSQPLDVTVILPTASATSTVDVPSPSRPGHHLRSAVQTVLKNLKESQPKQRGGVPDVVGAAAFFEALSTQWDVTCEKFKRFDRKNKNINELGPAAFAKWMSIYGTPADGAQRVFEYIDVDHSGSIQLEELLAVAQAHHATAMSSKEGWGVLSKYILDPQRLRKHTRRARRMRLRQGLRTTSEFVLAFLWRDPPDLAAATRDTRQLEGLFVSVDEESMSLKDSPSTRRLSISADDAAPPISEPSTSSQEANIERHAAVFAGHLDNAETELLRQTEALVASMSALRESIEMRRLETKTFGAVYPHLYRTTALRAKILRHHIMTDHLWQALQASLVRLEPYSEAQASETEVAFMSWTKVAALGLGVEERLRRGAMGAWSLFILEAVPMLMWALFANNGSPLSVAVCESGYEILWSVLALLDVIGSTTVFLFATAGNVYGWGILFGFLSPLSAIVPLLATVCRTIAYIRVYSSFYATNTACTIWAVAISINHLVVFANLVLSDVFLRRAPTMRLANALHISINLFVSIYLAPGTSGAHQMSVNATGIAFVDDNLRYLLSGGGPTVAGADAQSFILACDQTVLFLTLPSLLTTIMRPQALAFTTLPCQLDTMTFFYDREQRERELNGKRRYDRLARLAEWNLAKLRRCEFGALVSAYVNRAKTLASNAKQNILGDPLQRSDSIDSASGSRPPSAARSGPVSPAWQSPAASSAFSPAPARSP